MTATAETDKPDTVEIEDLDQFVHHLTGWHTNKVKVLQHMLEIPAGSEMQTEGGASVVLQGPFLEGFRAGLALALMELGTLPFAAAPPECPAAADASH